jgi:hypothetical protein
MSGSVCVSPLIACLPRRVVAVVVVGTRASSETNDGSGSGKDATIADMFTMGASIRSNMTPEAASFTERPPLSDDRT